MGSLAGAVQSCARIWRLVGCLFQLFLSIQPQRLGPVQRAHYFGIFLLPGFRLAAHARFIKRGIGQFFGQFVAHIVQLFQPFFAFANLGAQIGDIFAAGRAFGFFGF